jgi:hypothetical protein
MDCVCGRGASLSKASADCVVFLPINHPQNLGLQETSSESVRLFDAIKP